MWHVTPERKRKKYIYTTTKNQKTVFESMKQTEWVTELPAKGEGKLEPSKNRYKVKGDAKGHFLRDKQR